MYGPHERGVSVELPDHVAAGEAPDVDRGAVLGVAHDVLPGL